MTDSDTEDLIIENDLIIKACRFQVPRLCNLRSISSDFSIAAANQKR